MLSDTQRPIPLSIPCIGDEERAYVDECLSSGWVTEGRFISQFETDLASFTGSRHVVVCSSGTAALHVALLCMGVTQGDLVLLPSITFIASANAVRYTGAEPLLLDSDELLGIDAEKLAALLDDECEFNGGTLRHKESGKRVAAVMPVHVFGTPVDPAVFDVARRFELPVLEDAAESLGSRWLASDAGEVHTGTRGRAGVLSFNANKVLTAAGGGALLTDDKTLAATARRYIDQYKDPAGGYHHDKVGYNYRISNLHAAVGVAQLQKADGFVSGRRARFAQYEAGLASVEGLEMIWSRPRTVSNHWLPAVQIDSDVFGMDAHELERRLRALGVGARAMWTPVHLQPAYRGVLHWKLDRASALDGRIINLPSSNEMTPEDVVRVIQAICEIGESI